MSFKPTKEFMLTPRPCRHCGKWMSAEFLAARRFKKIERGTTAVAEYYKNQEKKNKQKETK